MPINRAAATKYHPPINKTNILLVVLLAVFIISRVLILLTSIESVSWKEDLSMGTIAREIIRGTPCPFWNFQLDFYSGESLVLGLAIIPFFLLLGQNLLALKIPTFLISIATILTSSFFVKRYFGDRASIWTAFFFIFCPPIVISHYLLVQSGHSEALLFSIGILSFFYAYLFTKHRKTTNLLIFGVLSGFGCWFFYGTGITCLTCLIVWIAVRPQNFFSKSTFLFLLAFVIGLMPWYISNLIHPYQGLKFLGAFLFHDASCSVFIMLKRFLRLIFFSLPRSFSFLQRDHFLRIPGAYGYFILCVTAIGIFLAGKIQRPFIKKSFFQKLLFFLIYPVVFIAIYAMSGMDIPEKYYYAITFRYYTPIYFFGFILLGIALGNARIPKFLILSLVALSLIAPSPLYFNSPLGQGFRYKGYSYAQLGIDWLQLLDASKDLYPQISKLASYFTPRDRRIFFWSLLRQTKWENNVHLGLPDSFETIPEDYRPFIAREFSAFYYLSSEKHTLKDLLNQDGRFPAQYRPYFYKGFLTFFEGYWFDEFEKNQDFLNKLSPASRHWAAWGLGKVARSSFPPGEEALKARDLSINLSDEEKCWYYRGIGSSLLDHSYGSIYVYSDRINEIKQAEQRIPDKYRKNFYWGVGWKLREKLGRDPQKVSDWIERLPQLFQKDATYGARNFDIWYGYKSALLKSISFYNHLSFSGLSMAVE